ncbi:MAG: transporter substrate-binding domain-containing protein [Alphaproteobacteria bacterium]|nr:transporter substrate-binding domain-containing protein [Alphaproteobacteria bacterium]
MRMFKFGLIIFMAVFLYTTGLHASPVRKKDINFFIEQCGGGRTGSFTKFTVTGFKDYPPFSWQGINEKETEIRDTNVYEYKGLVSDLVRETLNDMTITRIKDLFFDDFYQAQKAVLHGKTDLLFISYYIGDSAGQDYIYPAYFGNPFIVVSRASKKIDVEDASGLKGLKGVIRREEEIENLIRGILPTDTKLEVVEGPKEAFRQLLSGEVDFMITSPYAADAEARRFKIKDKLYYGTKALRHIKYFLAFSKLSACRELKKLFTEKFMAKIKDKSEMEKLIQKYIQHWANIHADEPPLEYEPANDS